MEVTISNLQPVGDKVFAKFEDPIAVTASGLYLSDKSQKRSNFAVVKAVGPGRLTDNGVFLTPSVSVGDKIIVGEYVEEKIEIDGEELIVINDKLIFAIVSED